MATITETQKDELKEKAERLWALDNAISTPFLNLHALVNRAEGNDSLSLKEINVNNAVEKLEEIKEAIRRYDNELPQEY